VEKLGKIFHEDQQHTSSEIDGRLSSLIWNTLPGNAKVGRKQAAGPHNACAMVTHSQAGKPAIFGHQKHGCGLPPFYLPDLAPCAFLPIS
jgi:hypothetical protein